MVFSLSAKEKRPQKLCRTFQNSDGVPRHQEGDHVRGDNWAGRPGAPDVQGQSRLEAWTHTNTYKVSATLRDTQQACVHEMDKDTHIHKQQTQFVWRV